MVIAEKDDLWKIVIAGPEESPFEGGNFELELKLANFPFKGPVISFNTKIHHPNVSPNGEICADMLETGDKWAPTKKMVKVMEKIRSLMVVPNLEQPMNGDAAKDYNNGTWAQKAKDWTNQYAK